MVECELQMHINVSILQFEHVMISLTHIAVANPKSCHSNFWWFWEHVCFLCPCIGEREKLHRGFSENIKTVCSYCSRSPSRRELTNINLNEGRVPTSPFCCSVWRQLNPDPLQSFEIWGPLQIWHFKDTVGLRLSIYSMATMTVRKSFWQEWIWLQQFASVVVLQNLNCFLCG